MLGAWEQLFDEIVERFDEVAREPKLVMADMVAAALADGGTLSRREAARLCDATGWSLSSVRRVQRLLAGGGQVPPRRYDLVERDGTFLDWVAEHGPGAFRFDELALSMVYANGGNRARFRAEVIAEGYPMPSEATLSRLWRALPDAIRDGASAGHRNRYRNTLIVRKAQSTVANERWQLDDFDLDLRVLVDPDVAAVDVEREQVKMRRRGHWIGCRPHLTLLIDEASRFVVGWMLLDHAPTAADVTCLFADAFEVRDADIGAGLIGGQCSTLVCDNAKAFTALATEKMLLSAATTVAPAPAYSPISKPVVERNGATIQELVVAGIAGVVRQAERRDGGALFDNESAHWLEFEQLERHVAAAITFYNYQRPHGGLKGRWRGKTPAAVYTALNTSPRRVSDEVLAAMHLPVRYNAGVRIVDPSGVFVLGEHWLDPALNRWRGKQVEVRALHHRCDRLAVMSPAGAFVCWVQPSTQIDSRVAGELVDMRIEMEHIVNRLAARARSAAEIRTADIAAGGPGSPVVAAVEAFERRAAEKSSTKPTKTTKTTAKQPAESTAATPSKAVSKPGGRKPARRPPKQRKVSPKVPAPTAKRSSALDVAERAALERLGAKAS